MADILCRTFHPSTATRRGDLESTHPDDYDYPNAVRSAVEAIGTDGWPRLCRLQFPGRTPSEVDALVRPRQPDEDGPKYINCCTFWTMTPEQQDDLKADRFTIAFTSDDQVSTRGELFPKYVWADVSQFFVSKEAMTTQGEPADAKACGCATPSEARAKMPGPRRVLDTATDEEVEMEFVGGRRREKSRRKVGSAQPRGPRSRRRA